MPDPFTAGGPCNRLVACATRDMSIERAAQLMRHHQVGCLVVADDTPAGPEVVGFLTDRDIVTAVVAVSLDPAVLQVEDVMSAYVAGAGHGPSMDDLMGATLRHAAPDWPASTAHRTMLGRLTLDDILQVLAGQLDAASTRIEAASLREHRRSA